MYSLLFLRVCSKYSQRGEIIGPQGGSPWLNMVPDGMYHALMWVTERYNRPVIVVTENGCDILNENELQLPEALNDTFR